MGYRLRLLFAFAVFAALSAWAFAAQAIELKYDGGEADDFTFRLTDGYLVRFNPPEFVEPVITEVSFYGHRFGLINMAKPPDGYVAILDKEFNKLSGRSVSFAEISDKPAWNHIKIDDRVVKDAFWVYLVFPSAPASGIMMGMDMEPSKLRSRTGNHSTGFKAIADGKYNWMVRVEISDGLAKQPGLSSADLTGPHFIKKDGGAAEGFLTLFKNGVTVEFNLGSPAVIDRIFVYGKLTGDWQNTDREFTVYLLDADLRIQMTRNYPFRLFTSSPQWLGIDVPDTRLAGKCFVIVEPNSRDEASLEIGYDCMANLGSSVTANGQPAEWPFSVAKSGFNWMIRMESK